MCGGDQTRSASSTEGLSGWQRFVFEDIEGRTRELPRPQRGDQVVGDHELAPADVDQTGAPVASRRTHAASNMPRVCVGQRRGTATT